MTTMEISTVHTIIEVHGGTRGNYLNDFWIVKLLEMGMEMKRGMEVGREMGREMEPCSQEMTVVVRTEVP